MGKLHNALFYFLIIAITIGFTTTSVSVREGSSNRVTVTVEKIGSTSQPVTISYTTEDKTAQMGLDYIPVHGVITFAEIESKKDIVIFILDDGVLEGDEFFSVVLSLPLSSDYSGVDLSVNRVRVEIEDDDSMYSIHTHKHTHTHIQSLRYTTIYLHIHHSTKL